MMIKKLQESEGATIGVEVSGKIDSEEENKWIEIFDKLIAEHGSINILVLLGWLVAADSPFGKLAVISEKHFELCHLQDAWNWVKE